MNVLGCPKNWLNPITWYSGRILSNIIISQQGKRSILDWKHRPKDLYTEYKLERWNLKPGKAKAAIWHWTNEEWVFFYDKADCEIDDPNLPPCYDVEEIPEELNTEQDWERARPNEVIPKDTKPRGCYRYYSPKRYSWITEYLYSEADLIWQPKDNLISKSVLKSRYLLSESWIKRLGQCDIETIHSKYKSPVYLYSRHRVEEFIADNAQEYAEWLTKRDRYIAIFNDNREKILAGLARATEVKKAQAKEKKQLREAQQIAYKFHWNKEENIIKQQMIACLTCSYSSLYGYGKDEDFLCSVHPKGISIEQMPCRDFSEK